MIRFTDFTEIQLISNSQIWDGIDKTGHSASFGALRKKEEKKMTSPFTISDILEGSVGILNNYNLCHIKTIEWNEIITGQNAKYLYVYKFQEKERDCTPCHETCDRGKSFEEVRLKRISKF